MVSLDVVGRFANGVINDVVVASNLFVIVETDLDVPVSEELVGAGSAGGIDAWVLGKDCLVKKKHPSKHRVQRKLLRTRGCSPSLRTATAAQNLF